MDTDLQIKICVCGGLDYKDCKADYIEASGRVSLQRGISKADIRTKPVDKGELLKQTICG